MLVIRAFRAAALTFVMHNRVIAALLCAAAVFFACGPHPQGSAQSVASVATAAAPRARERASSKRPAAVALASSLEVLVGNEVTFTLRVTNSGRKLVEVTFPSGQTHDFAVTDSAGREVWRWSTDRMFTQSLQTKQVPGGETVAYVERMPLGDRHGTYTVTATLRSNTHPVEQTATFTLP